MSGRTFGLSDAFSRVAGGRRTFLTTLCRTRLRQCWEGAGLRLLPAKLSKIHELHPGLEKDARPGAQMRHARPGQSKSKAWTQSLAGAFDCGVGRRYCLSASSVCSALRPPTFGVD